MNHSRRNISGRARGRMRWMPLLNAAFLLGLWLFESRLGEAFWLSGLLCYIPQLPVIVPTLLLLLASLLKRHWKRATAYALTLGWATHVFLGLQVPANTWRGAPGTASRARVRVRVMTYNIMGALGGVDRVAGVVRAQNPDVLFLEEAVVIKQGQQNDPVAPLHAALPGYFEARAGEVCIFSRFPVLAQAQHQFPNGESRFILEAILDVRGVPVRVMCVHPYTITLRDRVPVRRMPWVISQSLKVRNSQIALLLRLLENPPASWKREWREAPLLLAGDFNTPPRGRIYNSLYGRLSDSWREAGWGMGNSYSATLPVVRIDYVWHSAQWTVHHAEVLNVRASDHRPLAVELDLW